MNQKKNFVLLSLGLLFTGCYTQFSTIQTNYPDQQYNQTEADTLKSTDSSKARVDTVVTKDREVCVWERDLLGYPELRCYESNYSNYWYDYNYTPWWYRNDPYWSGYNRHHRYYYHNPYYNDYHGGGGGGSSSSSGNGGYVSSRNRSPGLNTVPGNSSSLDKSNVQQPPDKGSEPPHRNRSEGLSGLPQGNNLQKNTSNENPPNVQSNENSGTQGNNTSATPVQPERKQDNRRNPRSRF